MDRRFLAACREELQSFKNDIATLSAVNSVTSSSSVPGTEIEATRVFGIPVEGRNTEKVIEVCYVDDHFFETYGITFAAGEDFYNEQYLTETRFS